MVLEKKITDWYRKLAKHARSACLLATIFAGMSPALAQVNISDVTLFYRVFDAAGGKPSATELQRDYLAVGSQGLRDYIPDRIKSAEYLADQIAKGPQVFAKARDCIPALTALAKRTPQLINLFEVMYPPTVAPKVTVVIGAANSGGTTSPEVGVILGLEVTCANRPRSTLSLDDRFTAILAHELVHTQQHNNWNDTVLAASLTEGVAEFLGQLMSGYVINEHLSVWTKGKESEIDGRFRADLDKTDLSPWLYNGLGSPESPGDLGYWVGYRIAKSFYEHTADKRAAIAALLEEPDPKVLLRASGW